jgi:stage II sporulation protein AA (anti-sigma F factor antagonist)
MAGRTRTGEDGDVRIWSCVHGDTLTVTVRGELDLDARSHWSAAVTPLLESSRPTRVHVDLGGVSFMDSSGLGLLVTLRKWAIDNATALRLLEVPPNVGRVLDYAGVTELFDAAPLSTSTSSSSSTSTSAPAASTPQLEPD